MNALFIWMMIVPLLVIGLSLSYYSYVIAMMIRWKERLIVMSRDNVAKITHAHMCWKHPWLAESLDTYMRKKDLSLLLSSNVFRRNQSCIFYSSFFFFFVLLHCQRFCNSICHEKDRNAHM